MGTLLSFEQVKKAVMLNLLSDSFRVPMIMGDRGCGKTALAKEIADDLGANLVNIDANVLKEGEIGGLPIVKKTRSVDAEGNETINSICTYATHVKLQECMKYYKKNPKKTTILFIDEFNRCDVIVKRELMNLVLNREINGLTLPDNVRIICACNPSSDFDNYRDMDYQVEDMDEAQKDRFCWLEMKSDITDWISWASREVNGKQNIHNDVIEYLADREQLLNNIQTSKDEIKTSPRSWESVSNSIVAFETNAKKFGLTNDDLTHIIAGDIGMMNAGDFMYWREVNENPLIKPAEIFEGESLKKGKLIDEVKRIISNETILRKNVLAHNCLRYIKKDYAKNSKTKDFKTKELLFIEILTKAISNKDLMYKILLDLNTSKDADDKAYLKHILALKNLDIINAFTELNQAF